MEARNRPQQVPRYPAVFQMACRRGRTNKLADGTYEAAGSTGNAATRPDGGTTEEAGIGLREEQNV